MSVDNRQIKALEIADKFRIVENAGTLRSKSDVAMTNEALCKILCHNIVVLIHEMFELGIDPMFLHNGTTAAQRETV